MKERYERHGVSNAELKNRLTRVLNELFETHQLRAQYEGNMARVREVLEYGTGRAHAAARKTVDKVEKVHDVLDLDYLQKYR